MNTHINIDVKDNKLVIQEVGCCFIEYEISDTWPTNIKEICENLQDYLEFIKE